LNDKIENYLTPLTLATWKLYRGKFLKEELRLDTCFHTIEDIERLKSMLRKRYGFNCYHYEYKKSYYGIGIANTSIDNFKSLVLTYIPSNMPLKIRKKQIKNSHRFYSTNLFGLPTTLATRSLVKHKTGFATYSSSYNYRALMVNNFGNRLYSTVNGSSKNRLNPYYITGFANGESNFTILFTKNKTLKLG
jgi:hypothetical protein